ncbi:MAG: hypothetical protein K2O56_03320, partial [Muribaculaceae bacterium]|nr:hypothetical protein [Muribaculaceae bacterium]
MNTAIKRRIFETFIFICISIFCLIPAKASEVSDGINFISTGNINIRQQRPSLSMLGGEDPNDLSAYNNPFDYEGNTEYNIFFEKTVSKHPLNDYASVFNIANENLSQSDFKQKASVSIKVAGDSFIIKIITLDPHSRQTNDSKKFSWRGDRIKVDTMSAAFNISNKDTSGNWFYIFEYGAMACINNGEISIIINFDKNDGTDFFKFIDGLRKYQSNITEVIKSSGLTVSQFIEMHKKEGNADKTTVSSTNSIPKDWKGLLDNYKLILDRWGWQKNGEVRKMHKVDGEYIQLQKSGVKSIRIEWNGCQDGNHIYSVLPDGNTLDFEFQTSPELKNADQRITIKNVTCLDCGNYEVETIDKFGVVR